MVSGELHQLDTRHLQHAAVGLMRDGIFLDRRIHDHASQFAQLDDANRIRNRNGLRQQLFDAKLSESMAPAHQRVCVAGQSRVEKHLTREERPPRIIQPTIAESFVRDVACGGIAFMSRSKWVCGNFDPSHSSLRPPRGGLPPQ